jgi:excisionase family DNA binding protein
MKPLMTIAETARYLNLHPMTVYELAQQEKVPAIKIGRAWRFKPEDLEAWLRTQQPSKRRWILVVDDDAGFRETLAGLLTDRGHAVTEARGGGEAMALTATRRFDLVFLDILLPTHTGPEVFRALRQQDPEALVVLVTAYPEHPDTLEALAMGPAMLLRKPFKLDEIDQILRVVFKGA